MSPIHPEVQNLRGSIDKSATRDQIIRSFTQSERHWLFDVETGSHVSWTKSLPIAVLYEGDGLRLYDEITKSDGYYLYREELSIVQQHADDIASWMLDTMSGDRALSCGTSKAISMDVGTAERTLSRQDSALDHADYEKNYPDAKAARLNVVDLGAGRIDKALVLLGALHARIRNCGQEYDPCAVSYHAVDLQYGSLRNRLADGLASKSFLATESTLSQLQPPQTRIAVRGICASYLEALESLQERFLEKPQSSPPLNIGKRQERQCLLWLGSSFTNFEPEAAVALLRSFVHTAALTSRDAVLIGIDSCQDSARLDAAYGSHSVQWKKYAQNGMRNAGQILGGDAMPKLHDPGDWEYVARWDALRKRHVRFVRARKTLAFEVSAPGDRNLKRTIKIARGEHIFLSQSYKYAHEELRRLFRKAGLGVCGRWQNERGDGSLYFLKTI